MIPPPTNRRFDMTKLNNETRELSIDELDAVSGGFLGLVAAIGLGAVVGELLGGSAVDGFVATVAKAAREKL
jgi:hypothetical protein